jgi:hypothetical protein
MPYTVPHPTARASFTHSAGTTQSRSGRTPGDRVGGDHVGGHEAPDRDRHIETRPDLAELRRREVDDDLLVRPLDVRRQHRGAHPVTRLAARLVGQPEHRERRQTLRDVHLDDDRVSARPEDRR